MIKGGSLGGWLGGLARIDLPDGQLATKLEGRKEALSGTHWKSDIPAQLFPEHVKRR